MGYMTFTCVCINSTLKLQTEKSIVVYFLTRSIRIQRDEESCLACKATWSSPSRQLQPEPGPGKKPPWTLTTSRPVLLGLLRQRNVWAAVHRVVSPPGSSQTSDHTTKTSLEPHPLFQKLHDHCDHANPHGTTLIKGKRPRKKYINTSHRDRRRGG